MADSSQNDSHSSRGRRQSPVCVFPPSAHSEMSIPLHGHGFTPPETCRWWGGDTWCGYAHILARDWAVVLKRASQELVQIDLLNIVVEQYFFFFRSDLSWGRSLFSGRFSAFIPRARNDEGPCIGAWLLVSTHWMLCEFWYSGRRWEESWECCWIRRGRGKEGTLDHPRQWVLHTSRILESPGQCTNLAQAPTQTCRYFRVSLEILMYRQLKTTALSRASEALVC